jgi:hypothetical protein
MSSVGASPAIFLQKNMGSVGIKVNDDITHATSKKGLHQEDPMSPILINVMMDMLALLIKRTKDDGQIRESFRILLMMVCQFYNMQMILLSL